MRKMSGFEYTHVVLLKKVVTTLLDALILGDDVEHVLDNVKKGAARKAISKVTSKPKLFTCDLCDWQTRFASALKTHKKRIHVGPEPLSCTVCDFKADTNDILEDHTSNNHNPNKRNKAGSYTSSPSSSPPRKKMESDLVPKADDTIEMMDIEIGANDFVTAMLEKRLKELEQIKTDKEYEIVKLKSEPSDMSANNDSKLAKHLFKVHEAHDPNLKDIV